MNAWLTCGLIASGHVLLQAWPRVLNPFFGVDCWRHMLAAEFVRANRRLPVTSMDNYLFTGAFDYPPLLIVSLALFPRRIRLVLQAMLSPAVEALHGALVFALVRWWTGDTASAALAQIMFALVPITVLENSQLSARSPGSLLLSVTLLSATMFVHAGGWGWAALAVAAGIMAHLAHKMASQTLLLLALLALPALARAGGIALAGPVTLAATVLLFPGVAKRVLRGQWAVLMYHRRAFAAAKESRGSVESRSFTGRLVALAKANPAVTILGADPWIVLVAAFAALGARARLPGAVNHMLWFWFAAVAVLIVATSVVQPLRFLGDGPRYSFYLAFPVAVAGGPTLRDAMAGATPFASWIPGLTVALGAAIVAQIVFIQVRGVVRDRERSYRGDVRAACEILARRPDARAAVFPLCTSEVVAFFSGCRVLSTDSALAHAQNADFRDFNPQLRKPLSYFLGKYGVTHCLVENGAVGRDLELPPRFEAVYAGADYTLWAARGGAGGAPGAAGDGNTK